MAKVKKPGIKKPKVAKKAKVPKVAATGRGRKKKQPSGLGLSALTGTTGMGPKVPGEMM